MASRNIADLHPILQDLARAHMSRCEAEWPGQSVDVIITCTYRSGAEQNALYELGRTKKSHVGPWTAKRPLGATVTKARAGQSAHNFEVNGKPAALAYDVAVLLAGKPMWDLRSPIWQRMGRIGMDLGLVWYGAPDAPFKEGPHFQHALARQMMRGVE